MNNENVKKLYTERASLYHWVFIDFFRYQSGLRKFFTSNRLLKSNDRVLDAGCGSGVLVRVLSDIAKQEKLHGITFHAFDLTQAMLDLFDEWVSTRGVEGVSLKQADVLRLKEQLPNDWNSYDRIVSSAMFEYIPKSDIKTAISHLGSLLKEGGTFCLFITRKNPLMSLLIQRWWKANLYGKEEIREILSDAGFKNIHFKKIPYPYFHLNWWGFAVVAEK